jgi:hypothetical protein
MGRSCLRRVGIATSIMALAMVLMTEATAQTERGAVDLGMDVGPFVFLITGGHETVGDFGVFYDPQIGYFLSDNLVIGTTGFFYRPIGKGTTPTSIAFGAGYLYANYHFNAGSPWSPYLGGRIGAFNSEAEVKVGLGVQGGFRYFATRQLSINLQLEFAAGMGSQEDIYLLGLGLGLSYYIK